MPSGTPDNSGGGFNLLDAAPEALQTVSGLVQSIFSGRKRAERNLNNLANNAPQYGGSQPISNLYNMALSRYNINPTDTMMYKRSMNDIGRNTAAGLNNLQGRRGAVAGVNQLVSNANNAALNAEAGAEGQQNENFGQLAGATQLKNEDQLYQFQTNVLNPYQLKLSLAGMKAAAANQRYNAGLQNTFQGLSGLSELTNPYLKQLMSGQ